MEMEFKTQMEGLTLNGIINLSSIIIRIIWYRRGWVNEIGTGLVQRSSMRVSQ